MLYDRARELHAAGKPPEEIERTLLSEGAAPDDVRVVLGGLGFGPQPSPRPPPPLGQRVLANRTLKTGAFVLGGVVLAGVLYVGWKIALFIGAVLEGFGRGC